MTSLWIPFIWLAQYYNNDHRFCFSYYLLLVVCASVVQFTYNIYDLHTHEPFCCSQIHLGFIVWPSRRNIADYLFLNRFLQSFPFTNNLQWTVFVCILSELSQCYSHSQWLASVVALQKNFLPLFTSKPNENTHRSTAFIL